jgi:Domain of unknown function (DUF4382)
MAHGFLSEARHKRVFVRTGCLMKRNPLFFLLLLVGAVSLAACSGLPKGGIIPPGGGNGTLILTLAAKPLAAPPNTSVLSVAVTISGVSLTPSSGNVVNIPLPASTFVVDMTRLQSDSAFLGKLVSNIPAGSYTQITLGVINSSVTYCTQLSPGTQGCSSGSVATVTGGVAAPIVSSSPFPITISSSQTTALQIQLDISKALTINSSTQVVSAINLTQANVFGATVLPPSASSLGTNQLDFIEDVTGVVTAVSGSSVTVTTSLHGPITATANSSTFYSPNCTGFGFGNDLSCVKTNQLASMDVTVNKDGTSTLLEYDPLATVASDWIEGVVTAFASSPTRFQIVANDLFLAPSASLIGGSLSLSAPVTVNLATGATFGVDSKGLIVPAEAITFSSASDTSVLQPGQTVAVRVTSFTPASGNTPASATVNFVGLRFTRVAGSVFSVAPPDSFSTQNLPPYFGFTAQKLVQLNQAAAPTSAPTNYDGVTDATGLTQGQTVSIRALYFGPNSAQPFTAAKVRKH